jgi:hypothetical protein
MKLALLMTILMITTESYALRPLSGLIMGDIKQDKQYDPLNYVFQNIEFKTKDYQERKVQEYIGFYREGVNLANSCEATSKTIIYPTDWKKEKAIQSVASTLQYIGLDLTTRAIAKYANELTWSKDDYINVVDNLVTNYCSDNITVISKRLLKLNMLDLFERNNYILPSINNNPYYTPKIHGQNNSDYIKNREMALSVQSFIGFCSWSSTVENFGIFYKYLKNPFIMSFINRNIIGEKISWNKKKGILSLKKTEHKVRIVCKDIICRKVDDTNFKNNFPRMTGSSSLGSDLKRMYCNLFRDLKLDEKLIDKKLIKVDIDRGEEEINFELLNFISQLTGVPDFLVSSEYYNDAQDFLKDRIVDRWDIWAKRASSSFSRDILYEESLRVKLDKKHGHSFDVIKGNFHIDFKLTLGEFDRGYNGFNMLSSKFNIKLSHNFISWVKREYNQAKLKKDLKREDKLKSKIHLYVDKQIQTAKDKYLIPPFAKGIKNMIVEELINQFDLYNNDKNLNLSPIIVNIPVNIKYGLFALRYFSYKFNAKYR